MVGLAELARAGTALDERSIDHLHRLVASWAPLADLSFGDLLLYAPCVNGFDPATVEVAPDRAANEAGSGTGRGFVVLAHARANTGPTVHVVDPVGTVVQGPGLAWLRSAMDTGEPGEAEISEVGALYGVGEDLMVEEEGSLPLRDRRRVVDYVPVRCGDAPVAVLAREAGPAPVRHENPLETIYRGLYGRFARMIAEGAFPYGRMERVGEFREPRVGDGVLVFDREGRVSYASPNARSALHRLGVMHPVPGRSLSDLGLDDTVIRRSFWRRRSTVAEFTAESMIVVVLRAYPMVAEDRITGAVAMLRDVSELRQHDRLLLSKDATIREIHHRVKNNLQTVSSLLQLQVRRLSSAEAKAAVESSVRRISSIAMVHEHLALDTTSELDFDEVVGPLVRLVEEGLAPAERPLKIQVEGDGRRDRRRDGNAAGGGAGGTGAERLPARLVTRASGRARRGTCLARTATTLTMRITDDGPGVGEGFSLDRDSGLGLTIVANFRGARPGWLGHHQGGVGEPAPRHRDRGNRPPTHCAGSRRLARRCLLGLPRPGRVRRSTARAS